MPSLRMCSTESRNKITNQLVELSEKSDIINRLNNRNRRIRAVCTFIRIAWSALGIDSIGVNVSVLGLWRRGVTVCCFARIRPRGDILLDFLP
jgi:hypothetical protein